MAKIQEHTTKSDCKLALRFLKEIKLYASWRLQGDANLRSRYTTFQNGGLAEYWKSVKNGESNKAIRRLIDVTLTWSRTCEGGSVWACADTELDCSLSYGGGRDIKSMVKSFNGGLAARDYKGSLIFSGERFLEEQKNLKR